MDIPMMNEINDNTNAAAEAVKNAILNAMPAAGIDQTALDAAVAEIVAAMPSSAATAQTKAFTNLKFGTIKNSSVTISGKGRFFLGKTSTTTASVTATIDGIQYKLGNLKSDMVWEFFFEKSIVMKESEGVEYSYCVQT